MDFFSNVIELERGPLTGREGSGQTFALAFLLVRISGLDVEAVQHSETSEAWLETDLDLDHQRLFLLT